MHKYIDIGITNCSLFFPHLTHFQYPSMIHTDPCLFDMLVLCCFSFQLVELLYCYGNHYSSMACYICVDIKRSCKGTLEYGVCILGYTTSVLNNSFIHIHHNSIYFLLDFFFFLRSRTNPPKLTLDIIESENLRDIIR